MEGLRERLARPGPVIGVACGLGSPLVCELLARLGFDWVLVDLQHGTWDRAAASLGFMGTRAGGAVPVARAAANRPASIALPLDEGALGLIVPMVESAEEAERAVRAARYPPGGRRSIGPAGAAVYGPDYRDRIEEELILMVQIETGSGVEQANEIMGVEGVDGCWIGPSDLGASLGIAPGDPEHDRAMRAVIRACRENGKVPGTAAYDVDHAARWIEEGCRFISVGLDRSHLVMGARADIEALRGATEG